MNATENFEFVAGAFYRCTHIMAPGKSDISMTHTHEERHEAWMKWTEENKRIIRAFELSADQVFGEGGR